MIFSAAVITILDTFMWVLDGKPGSTARSINILVTFSYYILNPLVPFLWYFYADFFINRSNRRLKKILIPMLVPICVNTILTIMSIFGNVLFYIDGYNVYHRGRYFVAVGFICLYYLVYTICLIISQRRKLRGKYYIPMLFFALPPVIGAIIQNFFYGVSLIWVCVTFSILVIFINIQNNQLNRDYLTDLFNRRQLDNFLLTKSQNNNKLFGGLMIDIDNFKDINDVYGHITGDEALKNTADILRKTFKRNDMIVRYGGDEFVVLMEIQKESELKEAVARLNKNVAYFNVKKLAPYVVKLSIGYDKCSSENLPAFIEHIDKLMYSEKQNAKLGKQTGKGE